MPEPGEARVSMLVPIHVHWVKLKSSQGLHAPAISTVLLHLQQDAANCVAAISLESDTYLGSVPIQGPRCAALLVYWQSGEGRIGGQPQSGRLEMQHCLAECEHQPRRSTHGQPTPRHISSMSQNHVMHTLSTEMKPEHRDADRQIVD